MKKSYIHVVVGAGVSDLACCVDSSGGKDQALASEDAAHATFGQWHS